MEEESYKRPTGPVAPAKPVVIEIPKAKTPDRNTDNRHAAQSRGTSQKKEPDTSKDQSRDSSDEYRTEAKGIPIKAIPREFPVNIDQRVGIFVDVQNMFYTAKYKYNRKIDYRKLIEGISRDRRVIRALAYVVQAPDINQSQFKHILEALGFELRIKELRVRADGTAKGDWDMGIAIDSISMAEKLDVVALVSGDGDFTDLVSLLRARGIRVEVYSFPSNTSDDLIAVATFFHPLDEDVLMNW